MPLPRRERRSSPSECRLYGILVLVFCASAIPTLYVHQQIISAETPKIAHRNFFNKSLNSTILESKQTVRSEEFFKPKNHPRHHDFGFQAKSETAPLCNALEENDVDFTLVIQVSWSRFWLMEHQCHRWGAHPMSLAVWMENQAPAHNNISSMRDLVKFTLTKMGCNLDIITVSVLTNVSAHESYPVNRLRNLALVNVRSTHSITMDADFLVSPRLYEDISVHRSVLATDNKLSLVIPAFEIKSSCQPVDSKRCHHMYIQMAPVDKKSLLQNFAFHRYGAHQKNSNHIRPFQIGVNWQGHSSTGYQAWITQDSHTLMPINCFHWDRYEPYLVVRYCRDTPPFQEAFTGYGQNKISWIRHLRDLGWRMLRMGSGFCLHVPHNTSPAYKTWKTRRNLQKKMHETSQAFKKWRTVEANIPKNGARTPLCSPTSSKKKKKNRTQKAKHTTVTSNRQAHKHIN